MAYWQKGKKLSLAAVGLMLRLKALQEHLPQPAALCPIAREYP